MLKRISKPAPPGCKMNYNKWLCVVLAFCPLCLFISCCSGMSEVSTTPSANGINDRNTNTTLEGTDKSAVRIPPSATANAVLDTSLTALTAPPITDEASQQLVPTPVSQNVTADRKDSDANPPQTDPSKNFDLFDVQGCVFDTYPASPEWNTVIRLKSRDTILAWCYDYLEGEPTTPFFLLLDAPTGTIVQRNAWSAVFTNDNEKLIYGRPIKLEEESKGQYFENLQDMLKYNARKLGVPLESLNDAMFSHGSIEGTNVVQPVVRDMKRGTEKTLPIVGGGALGRMDRDIIGLPKPYFYEFPPDWFGNYVTKNQPQRMDIENGRWLPIKKNTRDTAIAALKGPSPLYTYTECKPQVDLKNGDVLLTTRDKTLGLVVLTRSGQVTIRGARLPEGRPGDVLCP